jgi:hypothetical protein
MTVERLALHVTVWPMAERPGKEGLGDVVAQDADLPRRVALAVGEEPALLEVGGAIRP